MVTKQDSRASCCGFGFCFSFCFAQAYSECWQAWSCRVTLKKQKQKLKSQQDAGESCFCDHTVPRRENDLPEPSTTP